MGFQNSGRTRDSKLDPPPPKQLSYISLGKHLLFILLVVLKSFTLFLVKNLEFGDFRSFLRFQFDQIRDFAFISSCLETAFFRFSKKHYKLILQFISIYLFLPFCSPYFYFSPREQKLPQAGSDTPIIGVDTKYSTIAPTALF